MKKSTPPQTTSIQERSIDLMEQFDTVGRLFLRLMSEAVREDIPMTRQEIRTILAMGAARAWTMGELARNLALPMSSLTVIVDRLVSKAMVRRLPCESDRRRVWVEATERGRDFHRRRKKARLDVSRRMLTVLSEEEQLTFIRLFRKVAADAMRPALARPARGQRRDKVRALRDKTAVEGRRGKDGGS